MEKLDLKKALKHLYAPSAKEPSIVEVPAMRFLMIDGAIENGMEPANSPAFGAAVEAIYGMAYAIKFASKQHPEHPIDYPVMALEGLWWVEDGEFDITRKDNWSWRLMIMQPDHVDEVLFGQVLGKLRAKRDSPMLDALRLATFTEGLCVQLMHIGPYADEPATVARMRRFAEERGYRFEDRHHEIYLGDPRRADPGRLKTVVRHPLARL